MESRTDRDAAADNGLFVALSRFVVQTPTSEAVRAAFVQRPRLVDSVPGFVKLDVIVPDDAPNEFWLITYWTNRQSYVSWHSSEQHRASHHFMPPGLKLVRGSTQLRFFEHVTS